MSDSQEHQLPGLFEIALGDLDGKYAREHFHGKTLEQAEEMFATGASAYTEDLMWMEPIGFRFYVQSAIRYCLSDRATNDDWILRGLQSAIWFQRKYVPNELIPCSQLLADFCRTIFENFDRYSPDFYEEELREKYREHAEYFTRIANEK